MKHHHLCRLGAAVRIRRKALALSQEQLAERSGFHRNYIGKIERGEQNVTVGNLLRIAEAIECPAHELLQEAGSPQQKP